MSGGKVKVASLVQSAPTGRQEPTPTTGINEDDTTAHVLCRQALDIVSGRLFDTSFRRSRSKSSPSSERPLISFCASIAGSLHNSVESFLVDARACRCPARLPARVKK